MLWRTSPRRSRRLPPAGFILPCKPLLVDRPPAGSDWLHEIKHDGYRIIARKEGSRVTLWSRHGTNFTDRMPKIAEAGCGSMRNPLREFHQTTGHTLVDPGFAAPVA
jgi:hypothetical protein